MNGRDVINPPKADPALVDLLGENVTIAAPENRRPAAKERF
jgi:hypothetical protein